MQLAEQWNAIEQRLDPRWSDARLELAIADGTQRTRALALLAPAGPGGIGTTIRFSASRTGVGVGPEAVRNLLRRLDDEEISGTLGCSSSADAPAAAIEKRASLAADWDAAVAEMPGDWSDLLCELELTSSDHIEPGALLLAPLNPDPDRQRAPHLPLPCRAHVRVRRVVRHGAPVPRPPRRRGHPGRGADSPLALGYASGRDAGPDLDRRREGRLMSPDPVAWINIEPGWKVLDAQGEEIGRVHELAGDENADIFDGLVIRRDVLSKDKYVPAEQVTQIVPGEVHISLTREQFEAIADYTEPVEEQIIPERSTWYQRSRGSGSPAVSGERRARVRVCARVGSARARPRGLAGRADRALPRPDRASRPATELIRTVVDEPAPPARGRSTESRFRSRI